MPRTAIVLVLVLLAPAMAPAAFHLANIDEFMSGAGGNANVQYVEIRMFTAGQTVTTNTRLTVFACDPGNTATVLLLVGGNVPIGGVNRRWIMASPSSATFMAASGISPDFTWNNSVTGNIPTGCGMVCWGAPATGIGLTPPADPNSWAFDNPNNYVDCIAYGGYVGTTHPVPAFGTTVSDTPGDGTHSLTRDPGSGVPVLACPTPTNNANLMGTFGACSPPTTTTTSTTTSSTIAGTPFGGDDTGCVPDTADHLKCSQTIMKAFSKLIASTIACHCKQATAFFHQVPSANADEENCEENPPKGAKAKFDAAITKLQGLGICTATQLSNATAERDALITYLDGTSVNGVLYCDNSSGMAFGDDDAGFVPADKDKLKCSCTAGKNLTKLIASTLKCHTKLADADFKGKSFDEEACEEHDPASSKAAHDKYGVAIGKLVAKGICPACLDAAAQGTLGTDAITKADGEVNGQAYPCN